jgi:hypothetical protein
MLRQIAAGVITAGLFAGVALAQDFSQPPTYGSVTLSSGFSPDPYTVNLQSGGSIDASRRLGGSCRGYIANAPDFSINYNAGSTFPLILSVNASSDTTLVVNGPSGSWYCDDDGGNGLNPSLRFNNPSSGRYDVWVGTYASSSLQSATLYVSEVSSQ